MEASSLACQGLSDLSSRNVGLCNSSLNNLNGSVVCSKNSRISFGQKNVGLKNYSFPRLCTRVAAANSEAVVEEKASGPKRSEPNNDVKLYVGLPLDSISHCNTINHAKAIATGLKALSLLGVDGVELPIWWGVAENEAMGKYEWSSYLALAEMVQNAGLKLHVTLCFHGSKQPKIPLPEWVSRIGESQPSIFFTDRSGQQYKDCLSFGVDDHPILDGKTPLQVYKEFCESFKSSFSHLIGSTITGISMGLGPEGELKYPSYYHPAQNTSGLGAGEFQCYDQNMLNHLKQHAEGHGNPLWGLGGPHDAPSYEQQPIFNTFFTERGGSWETPYGDFFLSWYSSQLLSHGDQILSLANSIFSDSSVEISGKIPLIHSWYKTRSHPSELTAGYYNTVNRNGYEGVMDIFSRNSCRLILPGIDLSDENQPHNSLSSPESLLEQITDTCRKHSVKRSGQNVLVSGGSRAFDQMKKNLVSQNGIVDLFIYQRMGAEFFSPEHFPSFTSFVRSLHELEMDSDDLADDEVQMAESLARKNLQVQAA